MDQEPGSYIQRRLDKLWGDENAMGEGVPSGIKKKREEKGDLLTGEFGRGA